MYARKYTVWLYGSGYSERFVSEIFNVNFK